MATNDHGHCPNCKADLNGGLIWESFFQDFQTKGHWLGPNGENTGKYLNILTPDEAEKAADEVASMYGATRTTGRWGREIAIYDMEKDRTVRWKCPDCDHEWDRK